MKKKQHSESYTVNDIALLLHPSNTTIEKYLAIPENGIATVKNLRECHTISFYLSQQIIFDEP